MKATVWLIALGLTVLSAYGIYHLPVAGWMRDALGIIAVAVWLAVAQVAIAVLNGTSREGDERPTSAGRGSPDDTGRAV